MDVDLRLITEPEAEAELNAAVLWYQEQRQGLGRRFLDAVTATIDRIRSFPRAGARVPYVSKDLEARRVPVRRFPYQVVYLIVDETFHVHGAG